MSKDSKLVIVTSMLTYKMTYAMRVPRDYSHAEIEEYLENPSSDIPGECNQECLGEVVQSVKEVDEQEIRKHTEHYYDKWSQEQLVNSLVIDLTQKDPDEIVE